MPPEELAQAASEPNQFALQWIQAVVDNHAEMVWPQMTPDFRLSLAQWWVIHNPEALNDPSAASVDRDELARLLAAEKPEHILFRHLARVSLRELRNGFGGLDVSQLGPGTRPRPIGPDLELVRLFYLPDLDQDDVGNYVFAAGAAARAVSVLVERRDPGWAAAGIGEHLMRPGWPPTDRKIGSPASSASGIIAGGISKARRAPTPRHGLVQGLGVVCVPVFTQLRPPPRAKKAYERIVQSGD